MDGPPPANSPAVRDPDGGGLVPAYSRVGTWADETDVRPTILHLAGMGANFYHEGAIYDDMLSHRTWPEGLIVASDATREELMRRLKIPSQAP